MKRASSTKTSITPANLGHFFAGSLVKDGIIIMKNIQRKFVFIIRCNYLENIYNVLVNSSINAPNMIYLLS